MVFLLWIFSIIIVPAICGIALEDTNIRVGRLRYVGMFIVICALEWFLLFERRDLPGGSYTCIFGLSALQTFFLRRTVMRLRDTGRDRGMAYLGFVPLVNAVFWLWLCIAAPE